MLQEFHCPLPTGSVAVHCSRSTADHPRVVLQCIARVPLPTTPGQCGSALQKFHCPLPTGSVAVHFRISTTRCP